ncbi:Hypothetical protein PHPALM_5565 [Phytophthora palmivora]|uniref:Uncharacterized protein n=1 Tax=Phytophthora palmivora TaxID=4796 RepID=A0A2P4YH33_9STRA|nr:Hypothetical protein PHPALM_5565 [Phytophthora palmivora]
MAEVEYVLTAVNFVATDGWKFLPQYKFNHKSGVWKHWTRFTKFPDRKWISHFATTLEEKTRSKSLDDDEETLAAHRAENLVEARRLADEVSAKSVPLHRRLYLTGTIQARRAGFAEDVITKKKVYSTKPTEPVRGTIKLAENKPYQPARYLSGELAGQWKDESTPSIAPAPTCGLTSCCPVPPAPAISNGTNHAKAFVATNSRETGGKYPLRSTNGTDALVRDYQRWMGGVDIHDQLRMQRYSIQLA